MTFKFFSLLYVGLFLWAETHCASLPKNNITTSLFSLQPSPPLSPSQNAYPSAGRTFPPSPTTNQPVLKTSSKVTPEQRLNTITLDMYFQDSVLQKCTPKIKGCLATCGILSLVVKQALGMSLKQIIALTEADITTLLEDEKAAQHTQCITDALRALKAARHHFPTA